MSLSLNTIKKSKDTAKNRKRIGRGNASGTGTYSGKGQKGQNCRSGVSGLKRMGLKKLIIKTPKLRGFKSLRPKAQVVKLSQLNEFFKENDEINPETLKKAELIDTAKKSVKILGNGKLTIQGLKFEKVKVSESAKKQIESMKGSL